MRNSFDLVSVNVNDPMRQRGVVYVGQYGTSGYAMAARGYICDFIMKGIPVSWKPLRFDDSELSNDNDYNILAKSVIDKNIPNVGTVILHCTADLWTKYKMENPGMFNQRNVIGYSVWETNQLPDNWSTNINSSVNELWCPSQYNMETFKNSGVSIPIRVVPHIFLKHELPNRNHIQLKSCSGDDVVGDNNIFTFYNISELNERKNVTGLVEAYCKAFTKTDPVRLILKVHYQKYDMESLKYCVSKIYGIMDAFPNHAQILLIIGNLTDVEILGLHSMGDCYVSLTRSEAFGLTIFDAFNYGKKIIVTGHGGQLDYLGRDYSGLVSFTMEPVKNMETFTHGYYMQGNQQWAYPNVEHAAELMRKAINV